MAAQSLDLLAVNTLRFLSVDQVEAANSGHPGLPLGAAPMAYVLFRRHLRFHPGRPDWFGRDRFVLSAGHGSALLYSVLHLFGYDLELDQLKAFRQLGSLTPGHPEYGLTPGVEATTGPLGQGSANVVGMAIAEEWQTAHYGPLFRRHTYALVSDGDLMEGISGEAASLAGHLKLGRLICLYDANSISLDGPTSAAFTEDAGKRYEAYGWQVLEVADGNDLDAIDSAIAQAKAKEDQPSLIIIRTIIGFGSPKAGTADVHGAPLGKEGTKAAKAALGWPEEPAFLIPDEARAIAEEAQAKGSELVRQWEEEFDSLIQDDPAKGAQVQAMVEGWLPENWDEPLKNLEFKEAAMATRDAGKAVLNAVAASIPWLVGGAADLASSTKTVIGGSPAFSADDRSGRNVWFGVREHAMGAAVNGMALSGLVPFGSTFLVFSDYMRGAIRLSSLMKLPVLWIFTHDSVFVGEDGPTHQPIEHVASLRLIPGMKVFRPADAYETAACFREAIASQGPACIILTRQALPVMKEQKEAIWEGVAKGAYCVYSPASPEQVSFRATGSEVSLALEAARKLDEEGFGASVYSIPCRELLEEAGLEELQDYYEPVGPVITVEAGRTSGWEDELLIAGGMTHGINTFGESGPGKAVYNHLGLSVEELMETARLLGDEEGEV